MTDAKLKNQQYRKIDAGFWAASWGIKLQAARFGFTGFEYQREPMSSNSRRICYLKSAQSFGATVTESLKDMHGMIMEKYKLGVAHIFPTNDEVGEFSKSIFKPLIANNKTSIGQYVKNVTGGTDTTSLKKVRDAFLYLRGARQSQKIGDSTESTSSKTAGFSVDKCVFDEVDYMDTDIIEKYKGRMGMSPHKHEVYLGNPSHEDFGIDLIFNMSDQRYWFRKCSCGHETCAELSFPGCVKLYPNGTKVNGKRGYIGCDKCGKEIPVWAGEGTGYWVAKYPEKSEYMHGYMASQLITPFNDPAEILEDYVNPPFGNLADVYRLRLGRPYSNKDEKLRKQDVLACCGNDGLLTKHPGPCAMGVDVGKVKHVIILIKTATGKYELLRAIKIPEGREGWNQISDLRRAYNVKSDVIDIRPYEDEARAYQVKHMGSVTNPETYLCEYSDTQLTESAFNPNTGTVKVHRTGIFDQTHRIISQGEIILPRQCPEMEEFARQCCNCARFEEKDKRRNILVHRYRPTGDKQEHFRNALNYAILAASGHRVGTVSRYKTQVYQTTDNSYDRN